MILTKQQLRAQALKKYRAIHDPAFAMYKAIKAKAEYEYKQELSTLDRIKRIANEEIIIVGGFEYKRVEK